MNVDGQHCGGCQEHDDGDDQQTSGGGLGCTATNKQSVISVKLASEKQKLAPQSRYRENGHDEIDSCK